MQFIHVNDLFPDEITKITNSLVPPNFKGIVGSIRRTQDSVKRIIDQLGQQSAEEQGLGKVITSAEKLHRADNHILYILKDAEANSGAGAAIGILKVGKKHLFLFDEEHTVREVEPLCVLDFYIKNSYQRRGKGKKLFDYMLQDQQTSAFRLAVDGPSPTMKAFLSKNYNLTSLIKQSNNFAAAPQFFADVPATARSWTRQENILSDDRASGQRSVRSVTPGAASGPAGRYTARQPPSTMADVIHGEVDGQSQDCEKNQQASSGAPTQPVAPSPLSAGVQAAAAGLASGGSGIGGVGELQRPSSLAVASAPPTEHCPAPATPADTPSRRDSQLTDKGFFDVKFYHKKLW